MVAEPDGRRRRCRDAAPAYGRAGPCRPTTIDEPLQKPFQERVLLEVEGLTASARPIATSSFKLRAGEILGIAGVIGSGREELTRTLAGFAAAYRRLAENRRRECARLTTPAEAVDLGVGYIPRERRVEGLVLFLSVSANITLADLASLTRYGLIDQREERTTGAGIGSSASGFGRPTSTRSASTSPAATSRKSCWRMAERQGQDPHSRPSDARPRCRREGGGLRAGPRADRAKAWRSS